jgi:predicted Zn-dependent protease with MMP-like domain
MELPRLMRIAEGEVQRLLGSLPPRVQQAVESCRIEVVEGMAGGAEEALGWFEGCSLLEDADGQASLEALPRIELHVASLWEHSGRRVKAFRQEVRVTLWHEIGHFLGLDEEEVAAMGLR